MISRRSFLRQTVGLAAAVAAPPAWADEFSLAAAPGPMLGGRLLRTPDFARLAAEAVPCVGIRPHRKDGVKLSREDLATPSGTKHLIHNYGHSGAGITLSWGCAAVVSDHVQAIIKDMGRTKPSVAVIGCGVIGLTVASELKRKWPALPVTLYDKTLDVTRTTSYVAGGQFEPSQIGAEYASEDARKILAGYLQGSARRIREIEAAGRQNDYGIAVRSNFTLDRFNSGFDTFTPLDVVRPPKRGALPFANLKDEPGREYTTWLVNPRILLPRLMAELRARGVKFHRQTFAGREQVEALPQTIIINCTGWGAKALFGDTAMQARRGHLAILKNPDRLRYFFSGGCKNDVVAYMFARQTDIVIGGTVIRNDETETVTEDDRLVCRSLVDNMRALFAGDVASCRDDEVARMRERLRLSRSGTGV